MAEKSSIQWTDATWNIARGCTKVDADCLFCYMYRESMNGTRYEPKKVVRTKTVFNLPLKLREPSKIFTSSLTDFFHEDIDSYRDEAWDIIRKCPQHTFQILTKRPERIKSFLPKDWGKGYKNVWLGTSIGSQDEKTMIRLYELLHCQSEIKFVSFEPLWGKIVFSRDMLYLIEKQKLNWAIIGGESGNDSGVYRYRECQLEWIELLIAQLQSVGTSVFVKQLGTYLAKRLDLSDRHGGDMSEWPEHLRIRQFPT